VRYGQGAALVFEFTGTVAAGVFAGYVLDRYLGTDPVFLIGTTIAAVIGGFVRLVQIVKRLERQNIERR
jgi:F0F1-type ATP synthase assembly protein I